MGPTMTIPRVLGILAIILVAIVAGQFANALFGNLLLGLIAAAIVGFLGFLVMRAGGGWLRVVGTSLLILVVAGIAYAAFVFWWNYG